MSAVAIAGPYLVVLRGRLRDRSDRRAFTLLELLLVMAVFAAVAAVAMPAVGVLLADRRLDRAADQLQAELSGLRARAIREGQVLALQTAAGETRILVEPVLHAGDATESASGGGLPSALLSGAEQATAAGNGAAGTSLPGQSIARRVIQLPEAVTVVSVATSPVGGSGSLERASMLVRTDLSAGPIAGGMAAGEVGETLLTGNPQPTVYFYPHGATSNAAIVLSHPEAGRAVVTLRGLTGEVRWEPVSAARGNQ